MLVRWLPDGHSVETKIYDAAEGTSTMVVPREGGAPTRVPTSGAFVASPDGAHRAELSTDHRQIFVQDADGGNSRELLRTASEWTVGQFQWSPNGKQIAVSSNRVTNNELVALSRNSGAGLRGGISEEG
jgi:Tol biopolymer transport system component